MSVFRWLMYGCVIWVVGRVKSDASGLINDSTALTSSPMAAPTSSSTTDSSNDPATILSYSSSSSILESGCNEVDLIPNKTYVNLAFQWDDSLMYRDEGRVVWATCSVRVQSTCQAFVSSIIRNTTLRTGHAEKRNENRGFPTTGPYLTVDQRNLSVANFTFSMDVFHHHQRLVYCFYEDPLLRYKMKSPPQRIGHVARRFEVELLPTIVTQTIGTRVNLTCGVESVKIADHIEWERRKNEEGSLWVPVKPRPGQDLTITQEEDQETSRGASILSFTWEGEAWDGLYKCQVNHNNPDAPTATARVTLTPEDNRVVHVTVSIVAVLLGAVIVLAGFLLWRKHSLRKKIAITRMLMDVQQNTTQLERCEGGENPGPGASLLPPAADMISNPYATEQEQLSSLFRRLTNNYSLWQRERSSLVMKHVLGEGNFGSVILGVMPDAIFQGVTSYVAVKTIKTEKLNLQAVADFEKEVEVMTTLRHENIVSLLGLCTETMPLYIIMEYMQNGPLNTFLMENAPDKLNEGRLSEKDLLQMGLQPCRALEYLADRNVVHRDISARNCLVGEQLVVKLADFGLSRGNDAGKNYYKKDGGIVPVKWMSPESLTFGKYTSANDVWAFGVLLWEVYSWGAVPYQGISNQEVVAFINQGGRLARPPSCCEDVWKLILLCWNEQEARITAGGLVNMLSIQLNKQQST